jgi:hypothetical protein
MGPISFVSLESASDDRATADVGAGVYRFRLINLTRRAAACGLAYLWSFEVCRVVYGINDGKCG